MNLSCDVALCAFGPNLHTVIMHIFQIFVHNCTAERAYGPFMGKHLVSILVYCAMLLANGNFALVCHNV